MLRANSDRVRSVNDDALEKAEAALERAQAEMTVLEGEAMKALTGESKMDINIIAIPYDPMIRVSQGKAYILPLQIDGIQGIIEMGVRQFGACNAVR